MASYGKQFLFLFCIFALSVISDSTEELGDVSGCEKKCRDQSLQDDLDPDSLKSCDRGCRFYSISKYLSKGNPVENCIGNCKEAYPLDTWTLQLYYQQCARGCEIQSVLSLGEDDKLRSEEEGGLLDLGTPVMQVRKVMAQVVGGFQIVKTSIITYFMQSDNNTLLAVQSEPVVMIGVLPDQLNTAEESDSALDAKKDGGSVFPEDMGNGLFRPNEFSLSDASGLGVERVSLNDKTRYAYLLHLLLLLAVVSLSLLGLSYCLAIARHHQKRALKAANLHVALQHEPLKLVRPEDLTKLSLMEEEEGQAPELPMKQDLALIHAKI